MNDPTKEMPIYGQEEIEMRNTMLEICEALREKKYNPISQIVGYILTEDPTYITTHGGARNKVRKIDRDELLSALVRNYLE